MAVDALPIASMVFALSHERFALFCEITPEAPANNIDPDVSPESVAPAKVGDDDVVSPEMSACESVTAPVRPATDITSLASPSILSHAVPSKTTLSPTFHDDMPSSVVVPATDTL